MSLARGRAPGRLLLAVAVVAVLLLGGGLLWRLQSAAAHQAVRVIAGPAATPAPPAGLAATPPAPARAAASAAPFSAQGEALRREQLALARQQLERAREALAAYQKAARYPHDSRPIDEHPDQQQPFAPVAESHPLRMPGGGSVAQGVRLQTTQERVFAAGSESSRITLALVDGEGRKLPLRVGRAVMREVTPPGRTASTAEFAMPVNDGGVAGDLLAGDGVFTAVMRPAAQGFGAYAGLIRLELLLEHAGQPGFIYFDLIYSPQTAAEWRPGAHETLVDGALHFVLPVEIRLAGRYVVSGRVDDAQGQPFALISFNGELPAGATRFRLPVNGRLVHDRRPALPLRLRDVEAFLLLPDTTPDRVMLPRLPGLVLQSAVASLAAFASTEWTSEERSRYLAELTKDVGAAEQRVQQLGP
ncbi:hypothetical protein [Aquabacterium sp. OR-4]|uniref:hypothetical protein n=1 Tax=Aquabacterium sp. OR-4 TaxID=2978127 RepID=UPI0028C9DEC9|nr:hypothetical protein [Aquabacterium sp. OR-4]MDT7835708.1 hypothetical protein [Aquabacterium sp. OR-4]